MDQGSLRAGDRLPWRRKLLFSILVFGAFLAAAEGVCRIWLYHFADPAVYPLYAVPTEFPAAAKYAPHHYSCYRLQPGYRRGGTSHNSLGFRGEEVQVPKPPGTFRIVCLGGSTTYTEYVPDDADSFPAQLQSILRQEYRAANVEVINAGCPGYDSWESLVDLAFHALDVEPDLVLVYHGVNDVHSRLVRPDAYKPDNSGRRVLWTTPIEVKICQYSVLSRILGQKIGLWRLPGVDSYVQAPTADPGLKEASAAIGGEPLAVLSRNPPDYFRRNLRSTIGVSRANGAQVLLATWPHCPAIGDYMATPHYEKGIAQNNQVVREVAEEQHVPCFDFAACMNRRPEFWRDGRHVNARGARLQAELFARFIADHGLTRPTARTAEGYRAN